PWDVDVEAAIELGREIESAGRDMAGITNSEGASVQAGSSLGVYANSHGFVGCEKGTRHGISCALIAGGDGAMQRDYWYDSVRAADDFMPARELGRKAVERTLARLGAKRLSTRHCPVLFTPAVGPGLIGHLGGAVSGAAMNREASFVLSARGDRIVHEWFSGLERPVLPRGAG